MNDKKNIDRLFQEKFKDFEASPSPQVWQGIASKLNEKKEDRRIIPLWFKMAGIAAALLIGVLVFNHPQPAQQQNTIVLDQQSAPATKQDEFSQDAINPDNSQNDPASDSKANPESGNAYAVTPEMQSEGNTKSKQQSDQNTAKDNRTRRNGTPRTSGANNAIASTSEPTGTPRNGADQNNATANPLAVNSVVTDRKNEKAQENEPIQVAKSEFNSNRLDTNNSNGTINQENKIAAGNGDEKILDTAAIATVVPNALEELLNEKENKTVTQNEPKLNRWQVSTNVAPIYFSSNSSESPLDSRLAPNSKDFGTDLAYGVGVRYAVNKKITLRTGINTVGMEQTTKDLEFKQTSNARALKNLDPNVRGSLIQIESKAAGPLGPTFESIEAPRKFNSSLVQRTGYIEVPVEMSYKLSDKKFTVEVIGGFSTLFLHENSIALQSTGLDMEIGKATNLNDMHFSTNLGVGLRYNFFKSFQFNVEPMFKYQLNTYSNSGNINPYMFGLYSGVSYRF